MSTLHIWNRVPKGSKILIKCDSKNRAFAANVRMVDDAGSEAQWGVKDLMPGPVTVALRPPVCYTFRFRLAFAAAAEIDVHAEVLKADGSAYGEAYEIKVQGKKGDTWRATIVVLTLQSA